MIKTCSPDLRLPQSLEDTNSMDAICIISAATVSARPFIDLAASNRREVIDSVTFVALRELVQIHTCTIGLVLANKTKHKLNYT
jgi:hypothetical protein